MRAIILINGEDVSETCRLSETRINYDTSRRITTASITIMGRTLARMARYDVSEYDEDRFGIFIQELFSVTILDGRDGTTKLFAGQITAMSIDQSDASSFEVFYKLDLNDWAMYLDRAVCYDSLYPLALPASDHDIIEGLVGNFCPRIALVDIATILPVIQAFDFKSKTARQVLDDICAITLGDWWVDFDGGLHYRLAADAPDAPFTLSTNPDNVASFPVRVSGYRRDFTNPVNTAYVRGALDPITGFPFEGTYCDPVSVATYGEYASSIVDDQITTSWDAAQRAKATVLKYAYPLDSGSFTIWRDGLALGMKVRIVEQVLGIDGEYLIRSMSMAWESDDLVRYDAQFGAAQPDLQTLLRVLEQRTRWKTSNTPVGRPAPNSVSDASIAYPGLSANVIQSVNASTIVGQVKANQIESVNAGAIVGAILADQVGTVNAAAIQGAIAAGQIGSVNATSIQGVIVSSQVADSLIDSIAKFANPLRPVPMVSAFPALPSSNYPANSFFYNTTTSHFYQVAGSGLTYSLNDNPQGTLTQFYHIGLVSAGSIVGLIAAGQIDKVTAGQITGSIQATQIAGVNASAISGTIDASHIGGVAAVNISGTISSGQIGSVNATTITINQLQDSQIAGISGGKLWAGTVVTSKLDTNGLDIGGGSNMPGTLEVYSGSGVVVATLGVLGSSNYGGWFKQFGAGGTQYSDAKIKSDASGNVTISGASFSVTGYSSTIETSNVTYDPTYSTLAIKNYSSSDSAYFVSRGLVMYYGSSKIGALVRSPSGGYCVLDFTAYTNGAYINLDASTGIRSDAGYLIGSNRVIDSTRWVTAVNYRIDVGGTVYGGATGTFPTNDGRTVTVKSGIITSIA